MKGNNQIKKQEFPNETQIKIIGIVIAIFMFIVGMSYCIFYFINGYTRPIFG